MADPRTCYQWTPAGLPHDPVAEATLAAIATNDQRAAQIIVDRVPADAWTDGQRRAIVETAAVCPVPRDDPQTAADAWVGRALAGEPDDACHHAACSDRADAIAAASGVPRPVIARQFDQQAAAADTNGWFSRRVTCAAEDRALLTAAAERASRRSATLTDQAQVARVRQQIQPQRRVVAAPAAALG